ncbi:hypothetical protein ASE14_01365 [Agromyces sp. Root81]|uniref:hypothetical protein n=1 Tax=Agromyces sp. Root81 TaxID=1736601 RepID=UPI0006F5C883|nr:hypothetical protein [Agromyces sp. Root81]KRC62512.1 hypothetical protein ASE14_01365 [Agromyces sp. Root81]
MLSRILMIALPLLVLTPAIDLLTRAEPLPETIELLALIMVAASAVFIFFWLTARGMVALVYDAGDELRIGIRQRPIPLSSITSYTYHAPRKARDTVRIEVRTRAHRRGGFIYVAIDQRTTLTGSPVPETFTHLHARILTARREALSPSRLH